MEIPEIHILSRIDWQFFGTLTFKSERLPERVRLALYFALLRRVAAEFRVYFPRLLWCLRQESGEQFGRRHFHYLLAGVPAWCVNKTTCFFQMSTWEKVGGGMARVSVFDPRLNGEGYILKCLGYADPGDYYESAKFGSHCQLMLSHSVLKVVRANAAWRDRRLAHRLGIFPSVIFKAGPASASVRGSARRAAVRLKMNSAQVKPTELQMLWRLVKAGEQKPAVRGFDKSAIVGNYYDMSAALTNYWQDFIDQMIKSGRYNNRSEVIRAGLRSLEEREQAKEVRDFEQVFAGGRAGEPDGKTIGRMVARQKLHRKARR